MSGHRALVPIVAAAGGLLLIGAVLLGDRGASASAPPDPVEGGLAGPVQAGPPRGLVVRYKKNASPAAVKKLEKELGILSRKQGPRSGLSALQLPETADASQALAKVLASGVVDDAGLDLTMTAFEAPNDPGYARQWHLHNTEGGLRAEAAWDLAPQRGAGVVVAVIDTGVAYEANTRPGLFGPATFAQAPDLAGVPIVSPWNFIHDDPHPNDDHGHGTHVAGTILQATNNGTGMAGVARGASLLPIKVLDYSGQGQASDLIEAIYYAVDHGAGVISMSLGFSETGMPDAGGQVCTEIVGLAGALDYADANGVTVIAATGNDGATTVSCPAAYPTVVAVGATRYDGAVTFYSNRGTAIDVTAPGGDPNADQNGDGFADGVLQQGFCLDAFFLVVTGDYTQFCDVYYSGTSMATPHVSGTAALLLGESPALTPAQVRYYLETTARDHGPLGWDSEYGAGIVDAAGALALLKGTTPPVFTPTPAPSLSPTPLPTSTPTPTPTPVPSAPTNLTAVLTGATRITLTWVDNATDEQYYSVERSTDGNTWAQAAVLVANSTTWTNYYLAGDTAYTFRVRALAGGAYSAYSNLATATTDPPPANPTNLRMTGATDTAISLAWDDHSSNEQYFRLERSIDGNSWTQVGVLGSNLTSWTNSGLAPSTQYFYRVRASVDNLYSGYSNTLQAATTETPPGPNAPTNLAATSISAAEARLTWQDNASDEQYYRIERSNDGATFAQVGLVGANTTTWSNSGLSAETTYFYRVRASAGTSYSDYSNVVSVTTGQAPAAPANLVATAQSADTIKLTWTDNATDEQYYRVERSADGASYSQVALLLANATSWTNYSLSASTTYFYRVRASAGTAYSAYSNVASATTSPPPAAPSGLTAVTLGPDSIKVTWTDNATNEQYYRVERSGDGTTFAQVAILLANSTSWTNTGLLAGTRYTYRVRASAGVVYSPYSGTASATTSAPPGDPSGLAITVLGPDSLRLNWADNATNEQYYRVERSPDGLTFSQVALLGANQTTWTNGLLTSGTTYFYRVRASAGTAYSGYSNVAFATTAPPPAAPSNLALSLVSPSSVRLTWEDNAPSEQYYRVERSTDGVNFLQAAILGANSTSWTNSGLANGTTYWYRVRVS